MIEIKKQFKTLKQAESFQMALYEVYSKVNLVSWPEFPCESGRYVWECEK